MGNLTRRSFVGAASAMVASVAVGAAPALASEGSSEASPEGDFLFEEVDGLIAITGYVGQSEEVVVPRSVDGTVVGLIWDGAFANTAILKVTLPKGVFYIGEGAFAGCTSLEEIVLPERLEQIGAHAFEGCSSLESIDLPDSLAEIRVCAFKGTSLAHAVIPDRVPCVPTGAFPEGCELVRVDGSPVEVVRHDDVSWLPIVEFGAYPQSSGEPEPIEWLVLEKRADGTALLLSRRCLACMPYYDERVGVTWVACDLRAWLNGEFLQAAFSEEERAQIVAQHLENLDNPRYGTPGGAATDDSVFLLSLQEVEEHFGTGPDDINARLVAYPTQRAVDEGVWQDDGGACRWWLRSPGYDTRNAAYVDTVGNVYADGGVSGVDRAVRPVCWVNLEP